MSDLAALERELSAILRQDFSAFVRQVFKTVDPGTSYQGNWHIDLMCEYLMALYERKLDKRGLIINVPPRSLKSIICSVALPAYILGHNPSELIVCGSYSQALAFEFSTKTRVVMQQPWYQACFPETVLRSDQNEKKQFDTTKQGRRQAVSVGATLTGFGGNFNILDDPVNPQQAQSDIERENANTWYKETWWSRLNDKKNGIRLLIMQRLHERDTTGYLLAEQAEDYEHLSIPALAEVRTVYDMGGVFKVREKGDILHPEREGPKEIAEAKRALGEYGFAGQYQQRPAPVGGGILKSHWWRKWPEKQLPPIEYIIQSYDTAYTEAHLKNPTPSYSARTTWGIFKDTRNDEASYKMILLENWHEQVEYFVLRQNAKKSWEMYKDFPGCLLIEAKASGLALISDLSAIPLPVRTYTPKRYEDKVVRAHRAAPYLESGLVYYTDEHSRYKEVIDEVATFPVGASDDYTDTVTQAINFVVNGMWLDHPDNDDDEDERDPHAFKQRRGYGA